MNIDRQGRFDLSVLKYVDGEPARELARGDVLFNNTNSPALVGKTTVVPTSDRLGFSNHMTRIRLEGGFDPRFVAAQLHYLWSTGYFRHRCANHVNQASISAEPLATSVPIRIPPSDEQTRIADVLDELMSDIDAGVASLEDARVKLTAYRASVLKAAVDGTLTAEWREEHPRVEPASDLLARILTERRRRWEAEQVARYEARGQRPPKGWQARYPSPAQPVGTTGRPLPSTWCLATVDQFASAIQYGTSAKTDGAATGVPVLRMGNLTSDGRLLTDDLKYLPADHDEFPELLLEMGDLLFNRTNSAELVGKTAVYRGTPAQSSFASYLIRVRLLDGIQPHIVVQALNGPFGRTWVKDVATQTVGQANVNGTKLAEFTLPLPPLAEQDAIVEIVEEQLSVVDHLEADLNAKLRTAQALRQAVLRHAFTGQLVPQDPADEPASALLARIAAEREARTAEEAGGRPRPRGRRGQPA